LEDAGSVHELQWKDLIAVGLMQLRRVAADRAERR